MMDVSWVELGLAGAAFALLNQALNVVKEMVQSKITNGKGVTYIKDSDRAAIYETERSTRDLKDLVKSNAQLLQRLTISAVRMQDTITDIKLLIRRDRNGGR